MACIKLRNPSIPKSTKGWLLIDDLSLPRFWATVWADVLKACMGSTTRGHHLYAKASHSYLFGSQQNKPLSLRSIHRVFEVASENLSSAAKKELAMRNRSSVTAHDLRHTCAVYRLGRYVSLGDEIDMAAERLRVFFGWAPSSPMPRHYARAYEVRALEQCSWPHFGVRHYLFNAPIYRPVPYSSTLHNHYPAARW